MRSFLLIVCMVVCFVSICRASELTAEEKNSILNFISAVKSDDPKKIAEFFFYPFSRESPIPKIKDKADFINRYGMLFDEEFKTSIAQSSLSDWERVGYRGIMFRNGSLWFEDKVIALSLSVKERKYAQDLRKIDEDSLFPALKKYQKNIVVFKTKKGTGRIDDTSYYDDGMKERYRYAFWNSGKKTTEEPDIVLNNGFISVDDDDKYIFKNGDYKYMFEPIPEDSTLDVYKNDQVLASYPVEILKGFY